MTTTPTLLSVSVIDKIQRYGPDLISDIRNGMRQVSMEILPASSSGFSSASPTISSASSATTRSISIPDQMISPQTYQYLGFSPNVAKYLFGRFERRVKEVDEEEEMLGFAQSYIRYKCEGIEDSSEDWERALDNVGIHGRMRSALLDPKHSQIRGIQPLSSWLCEMLETNHDALVGLEDTILSNIDPTYPSLRGGGFETDYTVPATLGDHINLFKSVSLERARRVITEDGDINLVPLLSHESSTDFAHRGGLYFTHQMWVATHYSRLIADACPVCDRRTIEISVPLDHLRKENMLELDFGDTWRQLVFYSRRDETYPTDLGRLRSKHKVIHGPIAHNANVAFAKMKNPSDIQKKHLLWENAKAQTGNFGMQHVWLTEDAVHGLSAVVREKTWMRKPEQSYALVKS